MDIVIALHARRDYDQSRDKFLGKCFGAKFKEDDELPDDMPIGEKIRQSLGGRIVKAGAPRRGQSDAAGAGQSR